MALRDELIRRISLLPEEALEDVARYIDQVMTPHKNPIKRHT